MSFVNNALMDHCCIVKFKGIIKNLCQVPTSYSNKHEDIVPKIQKKISAAAIYLYPQNEYAA